jgi:hypothetical protein
MIKNYGDLDEQTKSSLQKAYDKGGIVIVSGGVKDEPGVLASSIAKQFDEATFIGEITTPRNCKLLFDDCAELKRIRQSRNSSYGFLLVATIHSCDAQAAVLLLPEYFEVNRFDVMLNVVLSIGLNQGLSVAGMEQSDTISSLFTQ